MAAIGVNLLTCNRSPLLLRMTQLGLRSLLASDLQEHEFRIVVVDNASDDGTVRWLEEDMYLPTVRLDENLGIARARNVGYRWLAEQFPQAEWWLELHNDMIFPKTWLRPLLEIGNSDPRVGLISPGLVTGRPIMFGATQTRTLRVPWHMADGSVFSEVELACAVARRDVEPRPGLQHPVLKRVAMMQEIGLYDENMGLSNWEDTEEVCRVWKAHWKYLVCLRSFVFHQYSGSRLEIRGPDGQNEDWTRGATRFHNVHAACGGAFLAEYNSQLGAMYA